MQYLKHPNVVTTIVKDVVLEDHRASFRTRPPQNIIIIIMGMVLLEIKSSRPKNMTSDAVYCCIQNIKEGVDLVLFVGVLE